MGANVVITGRDEQKIKAVAEKCRQNSQQKVLEVVADMAKDEDIKSLLNKTINEFGKLDVLVNNAGIGKRTLYSDPNIMNTYEEIMNTNVRGVLLLSTLSVPFLEKTKGNIINISSIGGLKPVRIQIIFYKVFYKTLRIQIIFYKVFTRILNN